MRKTYFLFLILACLTLVSTAQQNTNISYEPYAEAGGFVGFSQYLGDLNPKIIQRKELNLAIGFHGRYNFTPFWAGRVGFYYGRLTGDDKNSRKVKALQRNLNFYSPVFEFSAMVEYNFLGYNSGTHRRYPGLYQSKFSPYAMIGLGFFSFKPKTTYQGRVYELQPLFTESYKSYQLTQFCIPIGAGVKWNFAQYYTAGFEIGYRKTFTDYLDDVSGFYSDYNQVLTTQGQAAAALSDRSREKDPKFNYQKPLSETRGNPRFKDGYMFMYLKFAAKINFRL